MTSAQIDPALHAKPGLSVAYNNLVIALDRAGWLDGAIATLENALKLAESNADARKNLGKLRELHAR